MRVVEILKNVGYALWAMLMFAGLCAQDLWSTASNKAKVIAGCVLGVVLLLMSSWVFAYEVGPDSNFGLIYYPNGTALACATESGVPETGEIYLCLVMAPAGEAGLWLSDGSVTFCTITGADRSGAPNFECGYYEEMKAKIIGI